MKISFWKYLKSIQFIDIIRFGFDRFSLTILLIDFWVEIEKKDGLKSCMGFSRALFSIQLTKEFIAGNILYFHTFTHRLK